jgi:acylphosphatase
VSKRKKISIYVLVEGDEDRVDAFQSWLNVTAEMHEAPTITIMSVDELIHLTDDELAPLREIIRGAQKSGS